MEAPWKPRAVPETAANETLADLRVDIDRIDASMHELLMERGRIIDRLIAIKARQGGGSAFRPAREAAMMRRFRRAPSGPAAARHRRGHLAHHHFDLHLCAVQLFGPCRHVARRCADARFRALSLRLHGPLRAASQRRRRDRRGRARLGRPRHVRARWRGRAPAPGGRGFVRSARPKSSPACPWWSGRTIPPACRSS